VTVISVASGLYVLSMAQQSSEGAWFNSKLGSLVAGPEGGSWTWRADSCGEVMARAASPSLQQVSTSTKVIWWKVESLLISIRQVAAAVCKLHVLPGVRHPHLMQCLWTPQLYLSNGI